MKVELAETDGEVLDCFGVMGQLRSHHTPESYLAVVRRQRERGYRLAYVRDDGSVRAVAGFRLAENLAWGRFLYIDDLVTDSSHRSRGYGSQLFDWCMAYAAGEGCDALHLDSGVQRFGAHRFYLRKGMDITSHHFRIELT